MFSRHLVSYHCERLKLKMSHIKLELAAKLRTYGGHLIYHSPKEGFTSLRNLVKGDATNRIQGLYGYDNLDHPIFDQAKKIEKRIAAYETRKLKTDMNTSMS